MGGFFYKVEKNSLVKLLELTGSSHGKVMAFLISEVGRTRNDFPYTINELANKVDMSYSQVQKALKDLEREKLIKKKYGSISISPSLITFGTNDYIEYKKFQFDNFDNKQKKKNEKYKLPSIPFVTHNSQVLILGHNPSPKDFKIDKLEKVVSHTKYYNDSTSYFWEFIFYGLKNELYPDNYNERLQLLKEYDIALYYLFSLEVEDTGTAIKKTEKKMTPVDINNFLLENPGIELIICNGYDTYRLLNNQINKDKELTQLKKNIPITVLPSTEKIRGRGKKNYKSHKENWGDIYKVITMRDFIHFSD